MSVLLGPQRDDWIDSRGMTCRTIAGHQRDRRTCVAGVVTRLAVCYTHNTMTTITRVQAARVP